MRIKGRKEFIPYALFEAFKARDERLELVPHYSYYPEFLTGITLLQSGIQYEISKWDAVSFLTLLLLSTKWHINSPKFE